MSKIVMRNKKLIIMPEFLSGIDKLDHNDWKIITTNERKYIPNLVRMIAATVSISMRLFSEKKAREYADAIRWNKTLSREYLHDIKNCTIIIIKPTIMSEMDLNSLKINNNILISYHWDTIARTLSYLEIRHLFDFEFTFEKSDALKHNLIYLPMFYYHTKQRKKCNNEKIYDYLFVGAFSWKRFKILKSITGVKVFFYLKWYLPLNIKIKNIRLTYKNLSHEKYFEELAKSKAIIEITLDNQSAYTSRFDDARHYNLKLYTFTDDQELVAINFKNEIKARLTLHRWIDTISSMCNVKT